ncbi:MAG: phosphate acyltransferase PlsX [Syntrophomonadaceae bacterium]|nr:phosphate acyltransferase PlsX [Syntrophomonadaceae bacterium]
MKIAVDAMGGDNAPAEIVKGAVEAARSGIADVLLVGNELQVQAELARHPKLHNLSIVHASEVIEMDEPPATALRKKKNSSIMVATRLVKDGEAGGLVSAGSTGAQVSAALLGLGRIPGIQRPAIATVLPTLRGGKLMLDVGANTDCKPQNLLQFALMGSIYANRVMGISDPKIGLLNIGTEINKGNELTQAAYELLAAAPINFIGNYEARDIPSGEADVIVCDGFVGNSILKFGEGLIISLFSMLQAEMAGSMRTRLGAALMLPGFKSIKKKLEYEEYGGAPLLGVQGVSIICHGSSKAKAITNAVRLAVQCRTNRFADQLYDVMNLEEVKDE